MKPRVIFSNENFVAVFKPSGFLSVPGRVPSEIKIIGKEIEASLKTRVFPVHRLDREVSGLILFALNAEAHRAANKWFEIATVKKTYQAMTEFIAEDLPLTEANERKHEWSCFLVRGKKRAFEAPYGAKSLTLATFEGIIANPEDENQKVLSWTLHPMTGRSHQLRYELSKRRFPILGDSLYGAKKEYIENAIALRSIGLNFSGCLDATKFGLPSEIKLESKFLDWNFKGLR